MNYSHSPVPAASIAWMSFSLVVSVGLPVALLIVLRRRFGAKPICALIGAAAFLLAVMVLESFAHRLILGSPAGDVIQGSSLLLALYGGIMAALFEEFARFGAMKLCMKKTLSRENALMYGVGHGGIEAVITAGLVQISNIITAVMINNGSLAAALSTLDSAAAEQTVTQVSVLWSIAPYMFAMSGVERILAVSLHIGLSYLVYCTVRYGKKRFFIYALAAHFAVDSVTVLLSDNVSVPVLEGILLVMLGAFVYAVYRLYRAEAAWGIPTREADEETPAAGE